MSGNSIPAADPQGPLDPALLNLTGEEQHFFKTWTSIQDDDELKQHIIQVQTKAYEVRPRT
jgi:hypothetical protein